MTNVTPMKNRSDISARMPDQNGRSVRRLKTNVRGPTRTEEVGLVWQAVPPYLRKTEAPGSIEPPGAALFGAGVSRVRKLSLPVALV